MLLTIYQGTEIIFGTTFFIFYYYVYHYVLNDDFKLWDIIWCTLTVFVILSIRYLIINYQLLQEQNKNIQNIQLNII